VASETRSPLRVGIVSTGLIAGFTTTAMAASKGCQPVAVSSRTRAAADAFAGQHGLAHVFDDWRHMVASPHIDAVYVATPTAPREAIAVFAAQQGKHVLAEKPFASLASLTAITAACQAAGVAFMDATHFTHHPRAALLRATLHQRIGKVLAVRSSFYFPNNDRSNVRFDVSQEPMGAVGDMAWYTARAVAEFTPADATPVHSAGVLTRDAATGAAVHGAGVLRLSDGCTATWDVGYDCGTCTMDLQLLGERGAISLDDFVLDWAQGFMLATPGYPVGFSQRCGVVNPAGFEWVPTPSPQSQSVLMMEDFAALAGAPVGAAAAASIALSQRTQALLDSAWHSLHGG